MGIRAVRLKRFECTSNLGKFVIYAIEITSYMMENRLMHLPVQQCEEVSDHFVQHAYMLLSTAFDNPTICKPFFVQLLLALDVPAMPKQFFS